MRETGETRGTKEILISVWGSNETILKRGVRNRRSSPMPKTPDAYSMLFIHSAMSPSPRSSYRVTNQ